MTQNSIIEKQNNLPNCNSLVVFVVVYISLFVIAGVILFTSISQIHKNKDSVSQFTIKRKDYDFPYSIKRNYLKDDFYLGQVPQSYSSLESLFQHTVFHTNESNFFLSDKKFGYLLSDSAIKLYWPYSYSALINCTSIREVSDLSFVAAGWTKAVYKGKFRGKNVAVKIMNYYGEDMLHCQKQYGTLSNCYERIQTKILKEIILLTELAHKNIVKIFGFCIPESVGSIALVTELGLPLDLVHLLQISWEDRLHLILGVAHILHYLAHSPLGSLSMNDFRRQQFVLVDGELKLSDVDDLGVGEPVCENDDSCRNISSQWNLRGIDEEEKKSSSIFRCVNFVCSGHNSRYNTWQAGQHFVKLLLPVGAPAYLESSIENLISTYELSGGSNAIWDTSHTLVATLDLVNYYKSGLYFNQSASIDELGFKKLYDSDFPGMFDYPCRFSISAVSCVISVLNEKEAAKLCIEDTSCKAVVLTLQRTWTGRTLAVFKNGTTHPTGYRGHALLVRESS